MAGWSDWICNFTAYIKASNTGAGDSFGNSVSLAADGNTLAVGAFREASAATGVDGEEDDNSAAFAGAAYLFTRTDGTWAQEAHIKAGNTAPADFFGVAVSLSGQGDTLAVGARREDNSTLDGAGAVYVFTRSGSWSQQAYVGASNADPGDWFGSTVSLNTDATVLAVGAAFESSSAVGVNGDQTDNSLPGAGAVYLFGRNGSAWDQQTYVKASNTDEGDGFGGVDPLAFPTGLGLSADGRVLAVGAFGEDSAAIGVDGDRSDNSAESSGAAYVYEFE